MSNSTFPTSTTRRLRIFALAVVLAGACGAWVTAADGRTASQTATAASERVFEGSTRPSREFALSLSNVGRVSEVLVKPGDVVERGQVLLRQDDEVEQARLEELQTEADVAARVETARQRAELARVQEQRQENLLASGGGRQLEFEEARLNRIVAEAQIVEEERQGLAAAARVKQIEVALRQKALAAPAAGVVRAIDAEVGEMHGPQEPVVRLVVIAPLTVEVFGMPPAIVATVKRGDAVQVRYAGSDGWRDAEVTYIDPVVNEATNEQALELELANDQAMPAGLEVEVRISSPR